MKWTRDEYIAYMQFEDVGKTFFTELFGPLIQLEDEWRRQGASEDEINMAAFGFDYVEQIRIPANLWVMGGLTPKVIEDTAEHRITTDELGRTMKLCKNSASIPLPLTHPVTDMDSWLKIKPLFEYNDERIDWDSLENTIKMRENGALVVAGILGGFDFPRQLMGEENLCVSYYEQPELITDILDTVFDTTKRVYEQILDKITVDNLMIHEDMAGKSGPLIGPNLMDKFMQPYYSKLWKMFSVAGCKLFSHDSDGNMNPIMDNIINYNVNIFYPCEPAAGMDMVRLRAQYGDKLAFKGGIDKHVLRKSQSNIVRELEYKLQPQMRRGVCFGLDHRITNGTSIENYRFYVNTAREMLGRTDEIEKGWARMAF